MKKLSKKLGANPWKSDRLEVVDLMVVAPSYFARHERDYVAKRLPFVDENLGAAAVHWAVCVGHKEKMRDVVKEKGDAEDRVEFAWIHDTYKSEIKETVETAKGAFLWADRFPQDRKEMKGMIQGGRWAVRWADEIGDESEMKSRLQLRFWKQKFDEKVNGKTVNYVKS